MSGKVRSEESFTVMWCAGKHDGDGKQLAAWQSMVSGGAAAILGPTVTNPFDVVKVGIAVLT